MRSTRYPLLSYDTTYFLAVQILIYWKIVTWKAAQSVQKYQVKAKSAVTVAGTSAGTSAVEVSSYVF